MHRQWLEENARRFEEKWGWLPPEIPRYRRAIGEEAWHFCQNCSRWPEAAFEESAPSGRPQAPPDGVECDECKSLREGRGCAFY